MKTLEHIWTVQEGVFCTCTIWSFPNPFKATVGDLMQTTDLALEKSYWNLINHSWSKPLNGVSK